MESIREQLQRWSQSLCQEISVDGLYTRCPIAHKWKAPYRSCGIREALLWRMHDLGQQTVLLAEQGHVRGARILLRSAIETLAVLIYLNQKMEAVVAGKLSLFEFDERTRQLLMGSKNGATSMAAVNILTVLAHAEKAHPGLTAMHERLSESAHPSYDGVLYGYSTTDSERHETRFVNNWAAFFGAEQAPCTAFVFAVFEHQYNVTWVDQMTRFEQWLRENDDALEAHRDA
ncbi:DUF5677 domain-containing protein [Lysobacter soli]|uniref:DUF5677 domain-containing protein n=1 Tax=Lysobacter soli TaxID=453783 RepID=UPI0037CB9C37